MLDILIVEDNAEIAALLCDFLRKENYVVSTADTGEKALALYEKYGAKLLILDIMLPGMDGFAVCSKIRESEYAHFNSQRQSGEERYAERLKSGGG